MQCDFGLYCFRGGAYLFHADEDLIEVVFFNDGRDLDFFTSDCRYASNGVRR